jgi:hypothetical protein
VLIQVIEKQLVPLNGRVFKGHTISFNTNKLRTEFDVFLPAYKVVCETEQKRALLFLEKGAEPTDAIPSFIEMSLRYTADKFFRDNLPNLCLLFEFCLIIVVSSVECERTFSAQNLIMTDIRNGFAFFPSDSNYLLCLFHSVFQPICWTIFCSFI